MGKVQVSFLLEGVGSIAAQFSIPELKPYLALEEMWRRSIIKGGHGVQLKIPSQGGAGRAGSAAARLWERI